MRAVLVGLDGATFSLLDRYAADGLMPEFARWKRLGAWAPLQSTHPPTTPPAWSSCVTGKDPGRHGVYDFREPWAADRRRPLVSGRSIRARRIWDVLGDSGRRSCVVNFPLSWPPEPISGVMVTGMLTPDGARDFASPPGEAERLLAAVPGYRCNIDIPRYDVDALADALQFVDDVESSLAARVDAFWHYWEREPWDFFFPTFVFHDRLGHLLWKFMTAGEGFDEHPHAAVLRPRIYSIYKRFDAFLGQLLDQRPDDLRLFLCSDHGFGGTQWFFEVNAWLEEMGLLVLKPGARLRARAFYAAMDLEERRELRRFLPGGLRSAVRGRIRRGRSSFRDELGEAVDWSRTRAFFPSVPLQGVVVCDRREGPGGGPLAAAEIARIRQEIREGLLQLQLPTGERAVDHVWTREELFSGAFAAWAPDLLFEARGYACLGRPVLGARAFFRDCRQQPNGFHRMDGVFMALGDGVAPGPLSGPAARIADIAPTLLHALGEALPDDLDGRVLASAFESGWLRDHPVRYRAAAPWTPLPQHAWEAGESAGLSERLRALGYVD
jgi:predicted AlkP superfamily phosphohydrolase/phosphomutase